MRQSFLGAMASIGAGGETSEILQIPSGKVGKLIGKAGSTIKDIQARGGARVKIDHEVCLQFHGPLLTFTMYSD